MGISYSSTLFKAFSCSRKVYNFTRPEKIPYLADFNAN